MSSPQDPTDPAAPGGPSAAPSGTPNEEELRAAYEAELARITAVDMIAQSAVSLLNIGARRMGPPPGHADGEAAAAGRDLEQVRDAIDAARALLAILERRIPQELGPLKDALSRLQMAYAQELGAAGAAAEPPAPAGEQPTAAAPAQKPGAEPAPASEPEPGEPGPGPAESSGRLWVPGR
jgi:hypothetical protein